MKSILLSICIPTLNRAEYLRGLLESLKSQIDERIIDIVEIVIVDGCSTDNTKQVIKKFEKELKITSFYRDRGEGIDKDLLKCIELSKGRYCWLLSDDDRFCNSAIHYVIEILNKAENVTGIFCNRIPYDRELTKRVNEVKKWPCRRTPITEELTNKSECFKRIGMDYGYLSSQIIRREAWNAVLKNYDTTKLDGCMYLMVDIIANMMNSDFTWKIINRPLIMQRTGNDSILARNGIVHRQQIEHNGFEKILGLHYKSNEQEYRIFINKIIARLPRVLANIKSQNIPYHRQLAIYKLHIGKYHQYPAFWLKALPIMLMPNGIFVVIKKMYYRYWI